MTVWHKSRLMPGIEAMVRHKPREIGIIQEVVSNFQPEIIVELGTALAGLTLVLHEAKKDALLYSFDCSFPIFPSLSLCGVKAMRRLTKVHGDAITFQRNLINRGFDSAKVHFIRANLLSGLNRLVVELLKLDAKKFLYCDNGNKPLELSMYPKYLHSGDIFGVHDYPREVNDKDIKVIRPISTEHFINEKCKEEGLRTRFFIRK